MSAASSSQVRPLVRVRGRSFMALVLVPEPPVEDWLAGLDAQLRRSPAYFAGKPVVLDLTALARAPQAATSLLAALMRRGITIVGLDGVAPETTEALPPLLGGGRTIAEGIIADAPSPAPTPAQPPPPEPTSLLVAEPVRSGRSVIFPRGDVTVIGSVGSGAEVVAGGSIHVYGALRGRAVAGVAGAAGHGGQARIFCRRLEAELLAIDGLYRTADDIDQHLRGKAAMAWLDGDSMRVAGLD